MPKNFDKVKKALKEQERSESKAAGATKTQVSVPNHEHEGSQKATDAMEEVKDAVKDLWKVSEEGNKSKSVKAILSESNTSTPDLEKQVNKIAKKIPMMDAMEGQVSKVAPEWPINKITNLQKYLVCLACKVVIFIFRYM